MRPQAYFRTFFRTFQTFVYVRRFKTFILTLEVVYYILWRELCVFVTFYKIITDRRTDGPTDRRDGRTDERTDTPTYRNARTHQKMLENDAE